ncbi:MAG: VOC family protein [Gaiellaceae bacterium MAG52_C11]|nr:VOC family protein [Candidatus Gaiellasilicea maunaloa]
MLLGIDHVQLAAPAGCEEAARNFFGEALGLEEVEKPGELRTRGGVWFRCGNQQLHIGVEEGFSPARKAHPAFHVAGYDALLARLRQDEIEIVEDDTIPDLRRSFVSDPFGNRIELLESLT